MIYVLFDNPSEIAYFTGAIKQPYEVMNIGSERGPHKKKVISCCWKCSRKVKDGDVIVCWLDFMAILCWWFCRNKKVKIIAVNILLKDSKGIAGYLKRLLYRAPLRDDSLVATVTSKGYGEFLNEYLGIQKEYVLLNDAYSRYKDKPVENVTVEKSVFCGGRNGRDWNKAFEIAQAMPDTAFNYVMSKKDYDKISKSQKSLPGSIILNSG